METDRELLELAAKAVGGKLSPGTTKYRTGPTWDEWEWRGAMGISAPCFVGTAYPLEKDGHSARLEAVLALDVTWGGHGDVYVGGFCEYFADHGNVKQAARRKAGVRAAAEIGRSMP